jgi:HAMP domain-containing protein
MTRNYSQLILARAWGSVKAPVRPLSDHRHAVPRGRLGTA